ncbi:hypothetical protein BaRGS_00022270, partial [Batillaria attramentaria]
IHEAGVEIFVLLLTPFLQLSDGQDVYCSTPIKRGTSYLTSVGIDNAIGSLDPLSFECLLFLFPRALRTAVHFFLAQLLMFKICNFHLVGLR